jgi:hypothetical protein
LILKNDPSGSIVSHRSSPRKSLQEVIDEEEASVKSEDEKKSDNKTPDEFPKSA